MKEITGNDKLSGWVLYSTGPAFRMHKISDAAKAALLINPGFRGISSKIP